MKNSTQQPQPSSPSFIFVHRVCSPTAPKSEFACRHLIDDLLLLLQVGSSSYDKSQVRSSSFDVFINFRGEDTRNIFVGHLHRALEDRGFSTFIDSIHIWKGDDIGPVLIQSIKGSKLSIAIFSGRYTESKWCLRELTQILECHETKDQIIIPIFFNVTPSDVKNQTGSFEISPEKLGNETPETLQRWKEVLERVGGKSGRVYNDGDDASKLVDDVVQDVWNQLDMVPLTNPKYCIGLNSRVQKVLPLLYKNVQFIGIVGMGGSGKTTIAADVYNHIYKMFRKFCFLENIQEQASQPNGIACLQEKLFNRIFRGEKKICSSREGSSLIKERLEKTEALLILDDVGDRTQLNKLIGDYLEFLYPRSRIIITSRDMNVLDGIPVENKEIHEPEVLTEGESLQLFSLYAFAQDQPPAGYMQLSVDLVNTAEGLPLSLEVLGSEFSSQKDKKILKSMQRRWKKSPHQNVYEKLLISYDSLQDLEQKAMFLDVACFFIGWKEEIVISIWEACGFDAGYCIQVLKSKSLLKITKEMLWMHNQIRDMGRKIAYRQRPGELDKYWRLWSPDDIVKVVNGHEGNKKVEGILYSCSPYSILTPDDNTYLHTEGFKKMPRLRLLQIDGATLEGSFQCLPLALRWLRWWNCPLEELPANFYHEQLIILDLSHGKFKQAWNNQLEKKFRQLKVLELSNCQFLSEFSDFSGFPCLEKLNLGYCRSLVNLHESIEQLKWLLYLNLEYCISIQKLPNSIGKLRNLKTLNLSSCESLDELPESIGGLKYCLVELFLQFTKIVALPDGVGLLKKLKVLDLSRCLALVDLPKSMENMESLHFIDLSVRDNLPCIPKLSSCLTKLRLQCKSLAKQFRGFRRINSQYKKVYQPYVMTNHLALTHGQGTVLHGNATNKFWGQIWTPLRKTNEGPSPCGQLQDWRDIWIHTDEDGICSGQLLSAKTLRRETSLLQSVKQYSSPIRYMIPQDEICSQLLMHVALGVYGPEITTWEDTKFYTCLNIEAYIHRKDKNIKCETKLVIEGIKLRRSPDHIVYFHEFKGFDWFGFQLQGGDAIEIMNVLLGDLSYEYRPYDSLRIMCIVTQLSLLLIKDQPNLEMFHNQSRACHYGERSFELIRYTGEISETTFELQEEWTSEPTSEQEEEQTSEPTPGQEEGRTLEPTSEQEEEQTSEPTPGQEEGRTLEPTSEQEEDQISEPTPEQVEEQASEPTRSNRRSRHQNSPQARRGADIRTYSRARSNDLAPLLPPLCGREDSAMDPMGPRRTLQRYMAGSTQRISSQQEEGRTNEMVDAEANLRVDRNMTNILLTMMRQVLLYCCLCTMNRSR